MIRFFLDTSAIVKYYSVESHSDKVRYLLESRLAEPRQFFVPNITILEAVGTFYRAHYIYKKITLDLAKSTVATFLNDLAKRRFMIYSLRQDHISDALGCYGHVFDIHAFFQRNTPNKEIYPCSSVDISIIAMAKLDRDKNGEGTYLVTNDKQMDAVSGKVGVNSVLLQSYSLEKFKEEFPAKRKK